MYQTAKIGKTIPRPKKVKIKVDSFRWQDQFSFTAIHFPEGADVLEEEPGETSIDFAAFELWLQKRTGNENLSAPQFFYRNSEPDICYELTDYLNESPELMPDVFNAVAQIARP